MRKKKIKKPMLCVIHGEDLDIDIFMRKLKKKSSVAMISDSTGDSIYNVYNKALNSFNEIRKQGVNVVTFLSSASKIDYDLCEQIGQVFKEYSDCNLLLTPDLEIFAINALRTKRFGEFKVTTGNIRQLVEWLIQKCKSEGYSVRAIVKPEKEKK